MREIPQAVWPWVVRGTVLLVLAGGVVPAIGATYLVWQVSGQVTWSSPHRLWV
jgi:hypothetical protein